MDFSAVTSDPTFFAIVGGHLLVLVLAILFTVMRKYAVGAFFSWVATLVSLLFGVFWFLALGGGRGNSRADESVRMALDPQGGLWITLYIVAALVISYAMTWVCKKGKERSYASSGPVLPAKAAEPGAGR